MSLNQNIKANQDEIRNLQEFTETTSNKNSLEDNNSVESSYDSVVERINEKKEELESYIDTLNQDALKLKGEILFYFNKELKSITKNIDNYIDTNNVIQNILDAFENKQKKILENSYEKYDKITEIITIDNGGEWSRNLLKKDILENPPIYYSKADQLVQLFKNEEWIKEAFEKGMSNKYYDYHLYALASIDKLALINNDTKWLYKLEKIAIDNPIETLSYSESITNFDENWYNILYKKIINNKNKIEQKAFSNPRTVFNAANKIAKIDNAGDWSRGIIEKAAVKKPSVFLINSDDIEKINTNWFNNLYQKIVNNKGAFKDSYDILNAMDKIAKIDNAGDWSRGIIEKAAIKEPGSVLYEANKIAKIDNGGDWSRGIIERAAIKEPGSVLYKANKIAKIDNGGDWSRGIIERAAIKEPSSLLNNVSEIAKIDNGGDWSRGIIEKAAIKEPCDALDKAFEIALIDNIGNWSKLVLRQAVSVENDFSFYNIKDFSDIDDAGDWSKDILIQFAISDPEKILYNIKYIAKADNYGNWSKEIFVELAIKNPNYVFDFKKDILQIDNSGSWSKEIISAAIQNNPAYALSNISYFSKIDKSWLLNELENALDEENLKNILNNDELLLTFDKTDIKVLEIINNTNYGKDLIRIIKNTDIEEEGSPLSYIDFNKLNNIKYRKLITKLAEAETSIIKMIQLSNHLIEMDYPTNKALQALDDFDSFSEASKWTPDFVKSFQTDNIWETIGTDFTKTDAKIGDLNLKDINNTFLSGITNTLESFIEDGVNLKRIDILNTKAYSELFSFIKRAGLGHLEEQLFDSLDFSQFKEFVKKSSTVEVMSRIKIFANTVHPKFKNILIKQAEFNEKECFKNLQKYKNPETGRLDVTQNNIEEINTNLEILILLKNTKDFNVVKIVKDIFPEVEIENPNSAIILLIQNLDVEEINFADIQGAEQLAGIVNLQNLTNTFMVQSANTYLENKFKDIDIASVFSKGEASLAGSTNMESIEQLRIKLNSTIDRVTGDKSVIDIAASFLRKNKVNYSSFNDVWKFATTWQDYASALENGNGYISKDVVGLYKLGANFAFNKIVKFLKEEIGNMKADKVGEKINILEQELQKKDIKLETILNELKQRKIPFEITKSNTSKALTRLANGNISYVVNKVKNKISGSESSDELNSIKEVNKVSENWETHEGVTVDKILIGGVEQAKLITVSQSVLKVDLMMNKNGMVNMKDQEKDYAGDLIFAAPLAFTTGDHKMTEIAIKNGDVMNYLISTDGKDGFVITNEKGELKILKKTELKLSDFGIDELLKNGDKKLDIINNLDDYQEFLTIMNKHKISLLSNMLLLDKGKMQKFGSDSLDSRRFLVTFKDGRIGVLDSTKSMSTKKLMMIAEKLEVERAVYMDTGMYDMATYYEPNGNKNILGHLDTDKSTNRVVFRIRNKDNED